MRFVGDRRGQSVVIGSVVLFGFLIIALASYQAFAVPAENSEIEFNHNQDLQNDMEDLRNSLLDVRNPSLNDRSLNHRPVRVQLGTGYPTRVITVNPPPAIGNLRSQDDVADVSIENAAISDEGFENADPLVEQSHPTSLLTYEPRYNEYREAPETTFEHSMLYNRFDGANLSVTGQRTIDGDDRALNVVVYEGGVNEQQLRTTMDPETLDATPTAVPIESDGGPIRIELPTNSPSVWEEELADEDNVLDVESTADSVIVELDDQEDWDLRMTRVGFDGGNQRAHTLFESVEPPEEDDGEDEEAGEGDGSGAGQGGDSTWSEDDTTETLSTSGGVWSDVGIVNSIVLSDPRLSPIASGSREASVEDRFFRFAATVGDPPGEGARYTFVVPEQDEGMVFEWGGDRFVIDGDQEILVITEAGDEPTSMSFEITADTIADWYGESAEIDLLDEEIYANLDAEGENKLDEIRTHLVENEGQEAYITDMNGRVDLTLELRATVDVQDVIAEDDEEFDVTTDGLGGFGDGHVVVENDRTGESTAFVAGNDETTSVDADDVGGLQEGDAITATLYEDDTEENELDSDTTVVSAEGTEPANFEIVDLTMTNSDGDPTTTFDPDEEVRFETTIENTGDLEGDRTISVDELIDSRNDDDFSGEVSDEQLTLDGEETDTVVLIWPSAENTHPNNNQDINYDVTMSSGDDTLSRVNAFTVTAD